MEDKNFYDIENEEKILGCLLVNALYMNKANQLIKSEYFTLKQHQKIFTLMQKTFFEENVLDFSCLNSKVDYIGTELGTDSYSRVLFNCGISIVDITGYCNILKDNYLKRNFIEYACNAINLLNNDEDFTKVYQNFNDKINKLDDENQADRYKFSSIGELCKKRLKEIEQNEQENQNIIKTDFIDFDQRFGGLFKKNLTVLAGRSAMGKALTMDTKILTPTGWKKNKDIKIGDKIIGANGKITHVLGVFPQGITHNFKITFSDGRFAKCSEDHLWNVFIDEKETTLSTKDIIYYFNNNKKVSLHKFVNFPSYMKKWDNFLSDLFKESLVSRYTSIKYNTKKEQFIFKCRNKILSDVTREKFWSFGFNCSQYFEEDMYVLEADQKDLYIKNIESIEDQETQCLYVDSEDHLFTIDHYIVTHNTTLALQIGINVARQGKNVLFFSQEMCAVEQADKIMSNLANISSLKIKTCNLMNEDMEKLKDVVKKETNIPFYINEATYIDTNFIRNEIKKFEVSVGKIDLIIVDHLQIMADKNNSQNRVNELDKLSMECKNIARDYDCAFLLLSQLSRKADDRDSHLPLITDLRESGGIEQNSDCVIAIYRDSYYLESKINEMVKEGKECVELQRRYDAIKNQADIIMLKNRSGAVGKFQVYFDAEHSLFKDVSGVMLEEAYKKLVEDC